MDFTPVRTWLALPPGPWPPDHYALLGLPPGAADPVAVEAAVMDRMDRLRRHQLSHPDLVTEGMNCLARALLALTDPATKAAYDAALDIPPQALPTAAAPPVFDADVFSDDQLAEELPESPDATRVLTVAAESIIAPASYAVLPYEVVPGPAPLALEVGERGAVESIDVVDAAVVEGLPAAVPDGLVARRWIYARLALVRKSLRAWDRLGPVFGDPHDPVDRPGRVLFVLDGVAALRPLLPQIRGVVGGVGEGGGVVAAVVRHPLVLDTFRRLLPGQRQRLAIDWRRGQEALRREYGRLRRLAAAARDRRAGARDGMVVVRWLAATPEVVVVVLALVAVAVALVRGAGHH